jgi:hypothetical protein
MMAVLTAATAAASFLLLDLARSEAAVRSSFHFTEATLYGEETLNYCIRYLTSYTIESKDQDPPTLLIWSINWKIETGGGALCNSAP